MSRNFAVPYWILAFVFCVIAVILCVAYVDRPVADFAEEIYRAHYKLVSVEHFLRPLAVVVVLAPLFLAGAAYWKLTRTRLSSWTEVPLLCSWSVVWALSAAIVLKHIFGRTQVYPTYIRDHIYGFRLLHGTSGYDAFPSGTTTVAAAILAVLWITVPRVRIVWALALALVAASLVITNAHFVADYRWRVLGCINRMDDSGAVAFERRVAVKRGS